MSSDAAPPLVLPASLRRAAERLAAEDGVSLEHWIALAVAQKVGAVDAAEALARSSPDAGRAALRRVLARVPDVPPTPGDELPDDLGERPGL